MNRDFSSPDNRKELKLVLTSLKDSGREKIADEKSLRQTGGAYNVEEAGEKF